MRWPTATFLRLAETTARRSLPADTPVATEIEAVAAMRANPADARLIIAVSLGAVFFGAVTYIGNGPNFMVKSIAESSGEKVPTFVGYIPKYSLPILLPSGLLFL